jgi:DNA-binding NtrC family response regulator
MEESQPCVTCYLANILIAHMERVGKERALDYPTLLRSLEGWETPQDPESFLRNMNNWVPLAVLRELEIQCEKISGDKEVAYHAAKAYFQHGKRESPSLFEIILQVLNDVRSAFVFANRWAAAQTNYLKLQSFQSQGALPELRMLVQFDERAMPGVGAVNLIRGFVEGFPLLYPFVEETRCVEEISQLRVGDIVREFPDHIAEDQGRRIVVRHRSSKEAVVEAIRVALKSESMLLMPDPLQASPESIVLEPQGERIEVLTDQVDDNREGRLEMPQAYQVVSPGVLRYGTLSYSFPKGRIYNAPYCRFRFSWRENSKQRQDGSREEVRREVSNLLFEYLRQMKQTQTHAIQHHLERRRLTLENIRLRQEIEREFSFAGMVGQGEKIRDLLALVKCAAETEVTALIQGETGTGKELLARAIHYNGPRKSKRFVAINCGALSETLLESELFGHEKGAFTGATTRRKGIFETADGGTLFLDEIGEISPATQVKLLRVLQEGELQRIGGSETIKVDVRIVAATNQILADLVTRGRVRQDLFYRLNVFPIQVPPLRERVEDIPLLVAHFIKKGKQKLGKEIGGVSPQAMALLTAYAWPGNIRELENVIQRMTVIAKGEALDVEDLPMEIRGQANEFKAELKNLKEISRGSAEVIEKRAILEALEKTGGNVTRAAKSLGISRATLQNKMKAYALRR